MKRLVALATAVLLAAPLVAAAPSGAGAGEPTITGPSTARYFASVTLSGTTPQPDAHVVVYFKGGSFRHWTARRDLHSNGDGKFSVTYRATAAYSYYARSGGVSSAARTTRLPAVSCRVSGVAFPFPFTPSDPGLRHSAYFDFAQLSTTRHGIWAGIAYSYQTHRIHLVSWRSGQRAVSLASYRYQGPYDPQRSIVPAGVTPSGAIVAAVQDPSVVSNEFAGGRFKGLYWSQGHKRYLARKSTWWSWTPTAVTDAGRIVGYAATGSHTTPRYYAVTWASPHSSPTVLAALGS